MSDTGRFFLRSVSARFRDNDQIEALHEVKAECAGCALQSTLTHKHGLVDIEGAGVLTCPHCGQRQGISRNRFEEFVRRYPQGIDDSATIERSTTCSKAERTANA